METTNVVEKQVNRFDNLSLADLVSQITEIDKKTKDLKSEKTCISDEILSRYKKEAEEKLKAKPEPFGVVNVLAEGYKLKIETPKDVEWDQAELAKVAKEISDSGEEPTEYIDIKYSVSETKYKSWPQAIKDAFIKARTLKPGKQTLKIEAEAA